MEEGCIEKASGGSFARTTRKTDEDEKDWDMTLYIYKGLSFLSWPFGPENRR